jgi:hypothetical protein
MNFKCVWMNGMEYLEEVDDRYGIRKMGKSTGKTS